MNLVQLVENKDYIGFKKEIETIVEQKLLNLFKEAKDEITSKAKVEEQEDKETDKEDKTEDKE